MILHFFLSFYESFIQSNKVEKYIFKKLKNEFKLKKNNNIFLIYYKALSKNINKTKHIKMKSAAKKNVVEKEGKGNDTKGINLKYNYSTLKELDQIGDYNFYGVIIDASFPIKVSSYENESHYECTIKLIDQTTIITPEMEDSITLVVKSTDRTRIPFIHNIGDIIRVHRGIYNPKKNRNVYLQNLKGNAFKSAWTLFPGSATKDEMIPYQSSHDNYTYEFQDKIILDNLRKFSQSFLEKSNSLQYNMAIKLNQRFNEGSDNDLILFVVKKVVMDDQITLFVLDETDGCELHTYKYFDFIDEGSVIRVRAFKLFNKNVIIMNEFSNILRLPNYSYLYKIFMNSLLSKYQDFKPGEKLPEFRVPDVAPKSQKKTKKVAVKANEEKEYAVKVKNKYISEYDLKTLDEIEPEDKRFLLNIRIMEIYPKPVYNFVNILCPNCQSCYFLSEVDSDDKGKFKCPKCKTMVSGKLHYNAKIHCRANCSGDKIFALHLNTYDDQGNNFFGIPPTDCSKNDKNFQKLVDAFKKVCSSDCLVLIEKYENGLMRIVGEYDS